MMSNLTDYSVIATSLFTAVAAAASWASVTQNKQDVKERRQPALLGSVTQLETADIGDTTRTYLHIVNDGGMAKNVACLVAIGDHYFTNPIGPGFLRHGQDARVETEMPLSSDRRAILMCRDLRQRVWVWDLNGKNVRRYDGTEVNPASDFQLFWLDFYGQDLCALTRVGTTVSV